MSELLDYINRQNTEDKLQVKLVPSGDDFDNFWIEYDGVALVHLDQLGDDCYWLTLFDHKKNKKYVISFTSKGKIMTHILEEKIDEVN